MLALLAVVAFLVGLVVHIAHVGFSFSDVWFWLLLGLTLLATHHAWSVAVPSRLARRDL